MNKHSHYVQQQWDIVHWNLHATPLKIVNIREKSRSSICWKLTKYLYGYVLKNKQLH